MPVAPNHSLHTWREIVQQPAIWPTTLARVQEASSRFALTPLLRSARVLLTGSGTSAYAASAIAAAWPFAQAVPSTDLLVDAERYLYGIDAVISLARSGNSPESVAAVECISDLKPRILQLAITCNAEGALARCGLGGLIVLDPRSNDESLVMTSSFSNLVLAGHCLSGAEGVSSAVEQATARAQQLLPVIDEKCSEVVAHIRDRIVVLSSSPLVGWGREAGLKALEMTCGRFPTISETYLGLRHGPMSFVKPDTVVLCLLSSDPMRRAYEVDLIRELRTKTAARLVGIADPIEYAALFDDIIPAVVPNAPDELRTSFEIIAPQLLGYRLSLRMGLNPDSPSPDGIINRVVESFNIYTTKGGVTPGRL